MGLQVYTPSDALAIRDFVLSTAGSRQVMEVIRTNSKHPNSDYSQHSNESVDLS